MLEWGVSLKVFSQTSMISRDDTTVHTRPVLALRALAPPLHRKWVDGARVVLGRLWRLLHRKWIGWLHDGDHVVVAPYAVPGRRRRPPREQRLLVGRIPPSNRSARTGCE